MKIYFIRFLAYFDHDKLIKKFYNHEFRLTQRKVHINKFCLGLPSVHTTTLQPKCSVIIFHC